MLMLSSFLYHSILYRSNLAGLLDGSFRNRPCMASTLTMVGSALPLPLLSASPDGRQQRTMRIIEVNHGSRFRITAAFRLTRWAGIHGRHKRGLGLLMLFFCFTNGLDQVTWCSGGDLFVLQASFLNKGKASQEFETPYWRKPAPSMIGSAETRLPRTCFDIGLNGTRAIHRGGSIDEVIHRPAAENFLSLAGGG